MEPVLRNSEMAVRLQTVQKSNQVRFFLRGNRKSEADTVKINHIGKACRGTIVKIRSTGGQTTQNGRLEFSNIFAFAGAHGKSGIADLNGGPVIAGERIKRHISSTAECIS